MISQEGSTWLLVGHCFVQSPRIQDCVSESPWHLIILWEDEQHRLPWDLSLCHWLPVPHQSLSLSKVYAPQRAQKAEAGRFCLILASSWETSWGQDMVIASILPGAVPSGPLHILYTGCGEGTASLSQQGRLSGGSQAVTVFYTVVAKRADSGAKLPGFKSQLCCLLRWTWVSFLTLGPPHRVIMKIWWVNIREGLKMAVHMVSPVKELCQPFLSLWS